MSVDERIQSAPLRTAVAAVVPCYNAGARLRPVVERLAQVLNHVFVVDDGSSDGAVAALAHGSAHIITFPENRGKGHAMLAGFRAGRDLTEAAYVAIVDADGQHDPSELAALYDAAVKTRANLVIGSRSFSLDHVPWTSWMGNRLTAFLTRVLLRQAIPDTQSGYRLHSRRLLDDVLLTVPGGRYETEMEILVVALRNRYKVVPVPIQTIYEEGNRSSHFNRVKDSFRIYRSLFRAVARSARPPERPGPG